MYIFTTEKSQTSVNKTSCWTKAKPSKYKFRKQQTNSYEKLLPLGKGWYKLYYNIYYSTSVRVIRFGTYTISFDIIFGR